MSRYEDRSGKEFTPKAEVTPGLVASLDLGASKIGCFILKPEGARQADQSIRIAGVGYVQSRGLRAGNIIDMDAASQAIGQAVERAEAMANASLQGVRVSVPGAQMASHRVSAQVSLGTKPISDADLTRAIQSGLSQIRFPNRRCIHLLPVSWSVDGQSGVRDPRNLTGRSLGLELLVITIDENVFNNIQQCVSMAHLEVQAIVCAPLAAAVAALEDDEKELGSICIDMGASCTTAAVFANGSLVHVDCLNVGGAHVTADIARGLSTTLAGAERLKTLHGSAIASSNEDREMVEAPPRGDDPGAGPISVPRSILKGIIAPRVEETFELLREKLKASGVQLEPGAGIVLTGGASQLAGVRELAVRVFDRPVRLGKPKRVPHLADAAAGPAFSAAAGVILRTLYGPRDVVPVKKIMSARLGPGAAPQASGGGSPVAKMIDWLRNNL
ncbi:cell division protein FtsA [Asticcacaulis sp. ZE23SCel15]|uniref:cell division protein FtsA n=1 Tax=Asticcacaulis sp. ZE23SCel15 TaxID=3059027 RepID=UPI00265F4096|nr:cell division protein FtsA [Asticcacaulis sp. ZE23SCel15]WKL55878.1 cell division protein FtsA [Asticcacaulis sp. ZE23SCel15]